MQQAQNKTLFHLDHTQVYFRTLSEQQIENYIHKEKPFQCAGSFKVEALGIALFERIISEDPTALQGLVLIALCKMLSHNGIELFGAI